MNTAEKLYALSKDFPEPILAELIDFAEFLRQKNKLDLQGDDFAQCVHKRFMHLDGDNLPIPARELPRPLPTWE
jgi:hypothetical protein